MTHLLTADWATPQITQPSTREMSCKRITLFVSLQEKTRIYNVVEAHGIYSNKLSLKYLSNSRSKQGG